MFSFIRLVFFNRQYKKLAIRIEYRRLTCIKIISFCINTQNSSVMNFKIPKLKFNYNSDIIFLKSLLILCWFLDTLLYCLRILKNIFKSLNISNKTKCDSVIPYNMFFFSFYKIKLYQISFCLLLFFKYDKNIHAWILFHDCLHQRTRKPYDICFLFV